ncbi:MAG: hypothetical protein JW885_11475 [Deltaproteobacteria bacterium]|nr:hypothetical protein [Candidatus Zymogenaceae bacterium]
MAIISDIQLSTNRYFEDQSGTALTGSFTAQSFGFSSFSILIINDDAAGHIEYSFDGEHVHGRLLAGESRVMDFRRQRRMWLRGESGGELYRLEVY